LGNLWENTLFGQQQQRADKIAKLLIELEANTQWVAVSEAWKTTRSNWLSNLQKKPASVAQALMQFEQNLVSSGMEASWAERKVAWRKDCNAASQQPEKVGALLLELESNLKWASVNDTWAARRNAWINECNVAMNGAEQTNQPVSPVAPSSPNKNGTASNTDANCTALQKLILDINTSGLKSWAATGKTTTLWGFHSKPIKSSVGISPTVTFTLATQSGSKGQQLQTAYNKYKQILSNCLQGYKLLTSTLYTDMVEGNNETWEKDGQRVSLLFSLDSDVSAEHYLYLMVYEKRK
jgi:hypothetical protein